MTQTKQIKLAELAKNRPYRFELSFDNETLAAIAARLDAQRIAKARFSGELTPRGKSDWKLSADLGASTVLTCVVSGDPVAVRIDEHVARTYTKRLDLFDMDGGDVEMPDDDSVDAFPETLDLEVLFEEALSLALPDYPRKSDAKIQKTVFAADGVTPLTDDQMNPFASLASLKDKLKTSDADG